MSNNSSNDFWGYIVVGAIVVLGLMWIFDAGPFEKSQPASTFTPSYGTSSGRYNPSFGSSSSQLVFSRKVKFYNYDGSYCYGTYELQTDGKHEYYRGSVAQRPSNSSFNYFVSFGGTFAYFN
ncbi:MAG: hypothetical protein J1F05_04625 [Muribaculaceae bacterium]|nr:hypothetical protein [Muribaculaceae bacterium]